MRLISIVASRPHEKKIGSEIIMKCLGTDYSHVSWVFWNSDRTKPRYYECVLHGGVTFTGQKQWEGRNKTVFRKDFEVSDEIYEQFLDEAMDKCGVIYSLIQNIGIKLASIFALGKNLFFNGEDGSNCSELIYSFKDKVNLAINEERDLVSPKDVVNACRAIA